MTTDLDVRRSTSVTGPDGVEYRILAAKRGVPLREQVLDGTGGADSIGGFVIGMVLSLVVTAVLEVGATGRST